MSTAPLSLVSEKHPDDLLTQREVAQMLNVDISWVKNHCTRTKPRLPFVKLGEGRYAIRRFKREHINKFIDTRLQLPQEMKF